MLRQQGRVGKKRFTIQRDRPKITGMITVECLSGTRINERPVAFTFSERNYTRSYRIQEVLDTWFGETADYFKVAADDGNIYLLKYDGRQDAWDLVLYQNPRRLQEVRAPEWDFRILQTPPSAVPGKPLSIH